MTVRVAIHQPNFLPRRKTLAKLLAADIVVILDDVQFNGRDYQHRAYFAPILYPESLIRFSWSLKHPQGRATRINDLEFCRRSVDERRLFETLRHCYSRSSRYQDTVSSLNNFLAGSSRPVDLWVQSMVFLLKQAGWSGDMVLASQINAIRSQDRSQRLLDLVNTVKGTEYLCGTGGSRYLNVTIFEQAGVNVRFPSENIQSEISKVSAIDIWMRTGSLSSMVWC